MREIPLFPPAHVGVALQYLSLVLMVDHQRIFGETYEALASDPLQVDIMLNLLHIRGFVLEDIFYCCWRVSPGTVGVVGHEEAGNSWISLGVETRPEGLVAWLAQISRT